MNKVLAKGEGKTRSKVCQTDCGGTLPKHERDWEGNADTERGQRVGTWRLSITRRSPATKAQTGVCAELSGARRYRVFA